ISPTWSWRMLLPVPRARQGLRPALAAVLHVAGFHRRREPALDLPVRLDVITALPESRRQAGKICGAERRGLRDFRPDDRHTEDVRLKLHQKIVRRGAAIDAQFLDCDPRIPLHHVEHIGDLKSDPFQRRPRQMSGRRASRDAGDRTARVLIPMRRTQARKRGNEIDAAAVLDARGELFNVTYGSDDSEPVAVPLNTGSST